ncbi:transposase IS4 family protein [Flexistipes sinusarabici DSM 4947]|uniref:Transposase IS4 family protein n=1 Tax=Flexistipes sinusarabici (strain ATCC 49648 / DSM 4947 / MAS 10) TaxID=717231 RepID=F8E4G3_FLESM|nr:transposase [Flexistipes sinusarabici]AEI13985.1 transposase IS4 family protein [Flexistipes sinusarabici DSM 4947]AEI14449.1 transposase IS4 family protein [Flexistipes sinusarabici DSM 4947]
MISETVENVKGKIRKIVHDLNEHISKPQQKYLLEMIPGCFSTGSLNLTSISGYLSEKTKVKHTLKRLQRNTENYSSLLKISNLYNIHSSYEETIKDERVLISVDEGDLVHDYGKSFELISKVRDGSSKKKRINNGYFLNHAVCYSLSSKRVLPLYLDIHSSISPDFKSANNETIKLLDTIEKKFKDKGIFVMDRGYDAGVILEYLYKKGLSFIIRSVGNRHVTHRGKNVPVSKLCKSVINKRYKKNSFSYGYAKCYYKGRPMTVISAKGAEKDNYVYLLCEGHIRKSKEAFFRVKSYFKRWKVEESFRFMKQQLGIERCLVRKFDSIKTMLGIASFCWNLLSRIESDRLLAVELERMSRREKYNTKNRTVCTFMHYRISDGIRNMLLSYNKRLFRFRDKKYKSDIVYYMKIPYYLEKHREREIIDGIPVVRRKKSLLVA